MTTYTEPKAAAWLRAWEAADHKYEYQDESRTPALVDGRRLARLAGVREPSSETSLGASWLRRVAAAAADVWPVVSDERAEDTLLLSVERLVPFHLLELAAVAAELDAVAVVGAEGAPCRFCKLPVIEADRIEHKCGAARAAHVECCSDCAGVVVTDAAERPSADWDSQAFSALVAIGHRLIERLGVRAS